MALWRRRQIEASLAAHKSGMMRYISLNLGAALALIVATQLADIPAPLSAYLFFSALLLLGILSWELRHNEADARSRRFGWAAVSSVALALAAWALPSAVGHLSLGFVFKRTLPFSTLMQMQAALIWGGYLGFLIGRRCSATPSPAKWVSRIIILCVLLAAIIIIGIVWMQARLVPDFQAYAQRLGRPPPPHSRASRKRRERHCSCAIAL